MLTVLTSVGTPVTLTIFPSLVVCSSTNLAAPSFSAVNDSIEAAG